MRGILLSALAAAYLFGAVEQSTSVVSEVAKLRQKYEECKAGQNNGELFKLKARNTEIERELVQKKEAIQSLEKTLKSRDKNYREAVAENERLNTQTNAAKVSRIERQSLTNALTKAKLDVERLESLILKTTRERLRLEKELQDIRAQKTLGHTTKVIETPKSVVTTDQSAKIRALQNELLKANTQIAQLKNTPAQIMTQEKIVTKVVEPTEKIVALQRELSRAQTTIANLRKNTNVITQEKIVEKIIYKDRPIIQEKIVTKVIQPTEKIKALQDELSRAQSTIQSLKNAPAKVTVKEKVVEKVVEKMVYKDRPVIQEKIVEKIVYKDRPLTQDKSVSKSSEATEKLNNALMQKLAQNEAQIEKLKRQAQKPSGIKTAQPLSQAPALPEKAKTLHVPAKVHEAVPPSKKVGSSAYRISGNAPIYNTPGGSVVDTWEDRRSFTAGNPSNGWVHITGYFINRVWTPTADGENLWVRESDVIRR